MSSSEIVNPFFDERDVRWANTNFTALRNAKHLINLACLLLPITAQYTAFFKQKCAATFFCSAQEGARQQTHSVLQRVHASGH